MSQVPKVRFDALDAIRGVAAMCIVLQHTRVFGFGPRWFPSGYLAVDVFFMLSGFVIAAAYRDPLIEGRLSVAKFMVSVRLVRLTPVIVLGATLGLVVAFLQTPPLEHRLGYYALALLDVPAVFGHATRDYLFPLNSVQWSLYLEVLVNLAYALLVRRLGVRMLGVIVTLCGAIFYGVVLASHGADVGWSTHNWLAGFPRCVFGFSVGVLIHGLRERGLIRPGHLGLIALGGAVVAGVAFAVTRHLHTAFDVAVIFAVAPLCVIVGADLRLKGWAARISRWAGEVSYPLYGVQMPVLTACAAGLAWWSPSPLALRLVHYLIPAVVVLVAWLVLKLYDQPVRAALRSRTAPRPPAATAP